MTEPRLRHLLSIADLDSASATRLLDTAEAFLEVSRRPIRKVPTLRGKTIINLFYEASTRTRSSFELAGKRLSADTINLGGPSTSSSKGESLSDTVATIDAMHADVIVLRHKASGAAQYVAARTHAAIVNAGDGMHEHPTQALLDAFTMRRAKGSVAGLTVAICGDILHSRVARSNVLLLQMLGAKVRLAGPRTLLPRGVHTWGCDVSDRLEPAVDGADVVMMLRIQQERLGAALFPSTREYARVFGLNPTLLERAAPNAVVMHPGPMNRGIEISETVADGPTSLILNQVEAGVAVRMAVLLECASETSAVEAAFAP
jgi:aspartate carbamoyltransferase catalytic subunit